MNPYEPDKLEAARESMAEAMKPKPKLNPPSTDGVSSKQLNHLRMLARHELIRQRQLREHSEDQ